MKLSFLSMAYSRYSLDKAFLEAERLKMDGIEVWGGRPHAYPFDCDDRMISRINRMAKDTGVEICAYTPENCVYPYSLCSQSERERRETVEYYKLALDVAKAMGARLIQITPGDPGYEGNEEEDWKHLCETLREVCTYAEQVEVDVVMETLCPAESLILTHSRDLQRLLREVPSPRLYGMMDMVNPFVMKESFSSYFRRLGEKMGHIHLADSNGVDNAHLVPGEGEIPFGTLLRLIEDCGYSRYCSIEISGGKITADPEMFMQKSVEHIRSNLPR